MCQNVAFVIELNVTTLIIDKFQIKPNSSTP